MKIHFHFDFTFIRSSAVRSSHSYSFSPPAEQTKQPPAHQSVSQSVPAKQASLKATVVLRSAIMENHFITFVIVPL